MHDQRLHRHRPACRHARHHQQLEYRRQRRPRWGQQEEPRRRPDHHGYPQQCASDGDRPRCTRCCRKCRSRRCHCRSSGDGRLGAVRALLRRRRPSPRPAAGPRTGRPRPQCAAPPPELPEDAGRDGRFLPAARLREDARWRGDDGNHSRA
ncbi:hypothetical protein BU14_0352s0001 [Porphyra umbilicalis]|uniref:Uncharacterized protein n=1 Tax=Porphyra umbilicalis TaxID=2786 RepID=A0A1X6NXT0_PORUM|nr:hypothetical protein BU14_0352s0001 [Porphyra umbilicalis]|eukprot:OSX73382.1 hypothetical protein BU14_0352s0001 [Porphyra umbilicalis]